MTSSEPPDRPDQHAEPELPPRLSVVLGNLEEAAAAHDGELGNMLSHITPPLADGDESLSEEDEAPAG